MQRFVPPVSLPWVTASELQIDQHVAVAAGELIQLRRHLHAHPEASGQERRTTEHLAVELEKSGLRPRIGRDGLGLMAECPPGDGTARTWIALRADIDALQMPDRKTCPYASTQPGLAHACGHDAHSAIAIGVSRALAPQLGPLTAPGEPLAGIGVRFLFQPAEETGQGATWLVEQGWLQGVTGILGVHVEPNLAVGKVGIRYGSLTAYCDEVTIRISGRGGHSARPHLTDDPLAAAAQLVTLLYQTIPRSIDVRDPAVLTFGSIQGGQASNVIPDQVELRGTLRSTDAQVHERLQRQMHRVCRGLEQISNAQVELAFHDGLPGVYNDPDLTAVVEAASRRVLSAENVVAIDRPSMGGEDFAIYLAHCPGMQLRLGCAPERGEAPPLHSPIFDVDERCIPLAARILARSLLFLAAKLSRTTAAPPRESS